MTTKNTVQLATFEKALEQQFADDPTLRDRFERAAVRSARAALREAGHHVTSEDAMLKEMREPTSSRGGIQCSWGWWGFQLFIQHQDLQNFVADASSVATAIGQATASISSWVALIAGFIVTALGVLRGMDHGRGVCISMSWFAPGIFVPNSL